MRPLMILPPAIFLLIAGLFLWGMFRDNPGEVPSALAGRMAPGVPAEGLPGYPPLRAEDLASGEISIVNFWASWCPPCRAEHPQLLRFAEQGLRVYGVNFRDKAENASAYLAEEGNPFRGLGFDPTGRLAVDWGVTAPPETFILDGTGKVLFRFVGPLVGSDFEQRFLPELEKAAAGS
jgi:cytochrome c biogenesis protein CcmG/thiol:disulfide interchange protein DsbE